VECSSLALRLHGQLEEAGSGSEIGEAIEVFSSGGLRRREPGSYEKAAFGKNTTPEKQLVGHPGGDLTFSGD